MTGPDLVSAPFKLLRPYRQLISRFGLYTVGTGIAAFFDLFLLVILYGFMEIHYAIAIPVAFVFSSFLSYFLNRRWAFEDVTTPHMVSLPQFLMIDVIGLVITMILALALIDGFGVNVFIARIIMYMMSGVITFFFNTKYSFPIKWRKDRS